MLGISTQRIEPPSIPLVPISDLGQVRSLHVAEVHPVVTLSTLVFYYTQFWVFA